MGPGVFSTKCHGLPKLKWNLDLFTGWPDYKMTYEIHFVAAVRPIILYGKNQHGYVMYVWLPFLPAMQN
jgi:uncharacterized protein YkwD